MAQTNKINQTPELETNSLDDIRHGLDDLQNEIEGLGKRYIGRKGGSRTIEKKNKPEKIHTNPKSGLTYNQYDQDDPRWKDVKFHRETTIGMFGGLVTATACIASMVESSITPRDVTESYAHQTPDKSIPKITQDKIKSERLKIDNNTNSKIKEHLKKGYPTIIMVRGPKRGGKNRITGTQQYFAIVDYRNNNGKEEVFIANTDNGRGGGWVSMDEALAGTKEATLFTPTGK